MLYRSKVSNAEEIVRLIHQQGGKAVLAHPGINLKKLSAVI